MHVDRNQPRKSKNLTEAVMELRKMNKLLEFVDIICKKIKHPEPGSKTKPVSRKTFGQKTRCQYCGTKWMDERKRLQDICGKSE